MNAVFADTSFYIASVNSRDGCQGAADRERFMARELANLLFSHQSQSR